MHVPILFRVTALLNYVCVDQNAGKLGFGNIRLNPNSNTGTVALLKENLQKILSDTGPAKINGPTLGKSLLK